MMEVDIITAGVDMVVGVVMMMMRMRMRRLG
jgi:hypothetical protein